MAMHDLCQLKCDYCQGNQNKPIVVKIIKLSCHLERDLSVFLCDFVPEWFEAILHKLYVLLVIVDGIFWNHSLTSLMW